MWIANFKMWIIFSKCELRSCLTGFYAIHTAEVHRSHPYSRWQFIKPYSRWQFIKPYSRWQFIYHPSFCNGEHYHQGRNQGGGIRGWSPSLSQVKVKKQDKISDSFDLFCVSLIWSCVTWPIYRLKKLTLIQ